MRGATSPDAAWPRWQNRAVAFIVLLVLTLAGTTGREALAADGGAAQGMGEIAFAEPGAVASEPDRSAQIRIPVPVIRAAGALERHGQRFTLAGIAVTDPDETCGAGTDQWPCGRMALTAIRRFVRMRTVLCNPATGEESDTRRVNCTVGGDDIANWLVTHGWARAEKPFNAKAAKAARDAKLGVWSQSRPGIATGPGQVSVSDLAAADAAVYVEVDLSDQRLTLVHRGTMVATWPVSTARRGKVTPVGRWRAQWLSRHHRSSLYNNAPMPYSVFFNGDYAIHGTNQIGRLGGPASAGCVRLHPQHAAVLFDLARREGPANTLVVVKN